MSREVNEFIVATSSKTNTAHCNKSRLELLEMVSDWNKKYTITIALAKSPIQVTSRPLAWTTREIYLLKLHGKSLFAVVC